MTKRSLRSRAVIGIACMAASAGLLVAPTAGAAPNALVGFGDSVLANPTINDFLMSKVPEEVAAPLGLRNPSIANSCATDAFGTVKQTAQIRGMEPHDYSCPGASTFSGGKALRVQVDEALRDGALDGGTREVLIQSGMNDIYGNLIAGQSPESIHQRYVDAVLPEIQRIRDAAPNAVIKVVGYPSITDNYGVCLLQMGNNIRSMEPLAPVTDWENIAENMMRDVAGRAGVAYVDLRGPSMGHGMCAPDGQRWYGALVDLGQPRNLPVHMTDLGKQQVAGIIADAHV